MSKLTIALPAAKQQEPQDPPPDDPSQREPTLLNLRSVFIREKEPTDLAFAIEDTAKLARVLHLALIGAIQQDTYIGTKLVSDWELLQELAYAVDHCAGKAEQFHVEAMGGDVSDWRRRFWPDTSDPKAEQS